jgi:hypothetical protein
MDEFEKEFSKLNISTRTDALLAYIYYLLAKWDFQTTQQLHLPMPDVFVAEYRHAQSSLTFTAKFVSLGHKLILHLHCNQTNTTQSSEVDAQDFVQSEPLDSEGNRVGCRQLYCRLSQLQERIRRELVDGAVPEHTELGHSSRPPHEEETQRGGFKRDLPRFPTPQTNPHFERGSSHPPIRPPFAIGDADRNPIPGRVNPAGGMLIGPQHPGFFSPNSPDFNEEVNPAYLPP